MQLVVTVHSFRFFELAIEAEESEILAFNCEEDLHFVSHDGPIQTMDPAMLVSLLRNPVARLHNTNYAVLLLGLLVHHAETVIAALLPVLELRRHVVDIWLLGTCQ